MEEWKDCYFNSKYECSNHGKIRNKITKRELKSWSANGYKYTWLGSIKVNNETKKIKSSVHRIIASSFLGFEKDKEIDHIDRNKANNRLDNLRWVTKSENGMNKDVKNYRIQRVNGYTYYTVDFTAENNRITDRFKTEAEAVQRVEYLRQKYR